MPTIRDINLEKERTQRLERLKLAREFGASLGVESARRYTNQKLQQEVAVRKEIEQLLLREKEAASKAKAAAAAEQKTKRGEGMRNAQNFSVGLAAKAATENNAWEAEKRLEKVRYTVALHTKQLDGEMTRIDTTARVANKQRALSIEANRTTKLLSRSQNTVAFASLAVPLAATVPTVRLAAPPSSSEALEENTTRFAQKRGAQLASQKARIEEEYHKSGVRSTQILRQKRAEEELERVERDNEALLKKSMLEHAMRSIRPESSHDLQQQEARRSTFLAQKACKDFEEEFLGGPWPVEKVKKHHMPPSHIVPEDGAAGGGESGVEEEFAVFKKAPIDTLLAGVPMVSLPVDELFARIVLPSDAADDRSAAEAEEPVPLPHEGGAPLPTVLPSNETLRERQVPRMATGRATAHSSERSEGTEKIATPRSLPPMPPPKASDRSSVSLPDASVVAVGTREGPEGAEHVSTSEYLEERNRQFLQQLSVLQRRLESAKSLTAPLHRTSLDQSSASTESDITSASHDDGDDGDANDVNRAPFNKDEHTGKGLSESSGNDARDRKGVTLAMTKEQLRDAIRRMHDRQRF